MIQVQNLTKRYGSFTAINDLSFQIDKGEIVGFLGPNGAGKSTTMKILTSVLPPTSGNAHLAGFHCQSEPMEVRKRLGYLPENIPLYGDMTPRELLSFVARLKGIIGKDITAEVSNIEGMLQVSPFAHTLIRSLSKGQKQRVGVAQALIGKPDILILDEPTVGLDPKQIHEMRELIKEMKEKRTVLLSTHILPEVSMTCQRIIIINKGEIVAEEKTNRLMESFNNQERIIIETAGATKTEIQTVLSPLEGMIKLHFPHKEPEDKNETFSFEAEVKTEEGNELKRAISHAIVTGGYGLLQLHTSGKSLEDIFLQLVTEEKREVR